jgi:hypothetical protein
VQVEEKERMAQDQKSLGNIYRETNCPSCGAPLEGRMLRCGYCKTEFGPRLTEEELEESCMMFIESMNKSLSEIISTKLVLIFTIGVILCPVGVYFLVKFFDGSTLLKWGLTGLTVLAGMILFGFSISQEETRMYKKELKPRIQRFLEKNKLQPEEFLSIARRVLKEGDPLFQHLDELLG